MPDDDTSDAAEMDTLDDLVESTRGPRAGIVEGLRFHGGSANSREIRQYGDIPSSTYHFNRLVEQDMIRETGQEYVTEGGSATAYELTDLGEKIADEILDQSGAATTVAQLEDQIDSLQQRVDDLEDDRQRIGNLEEQIGAMKRVLRRITQEMGLLSDEAEKRIFGDESDGGS